MTLDLNKLSAIALVELQHGVAIELVEWQKYFAKGYVDAQTTVVKLQKEVEELH